MEKQLNYFSIDGAFGGSQDWFKNIVMHVGGCAAATACDSCIYFAGEFGRRNLYPYDLEQLSRNDYVKFSQKMKPYIRPRVRGVYKLEWYIEGMSRYLSDIGEQIEMEEFSGNNSYESARDLVKEQIDKGYPIPCLMLHHKDQTQFKDFTWHWFLVVGYQEKDDDLMISIATYGHKTVFSLRQLWDTGYEEKGGFIRYKELCEAKS